MAKKDVQVKYRFDKISALKIGKGLLIALAGAALTHLTEVVSASDLGQFAPVVVAGWSVVVNAVREFIKGK